MNLRHRLIVIASCVGLTAMSLPAGPSCNTQVRFVKLAKNAGEIAQIQRSTTGGSIWIATR